MLIFLQFMTLIRHLYIKIIIRDNSISFRKMRGSQLVYFNFKAETL